MNSIISTIKIASMALVLFAASDTAEVKRGDPLPRNGALGAQLQPDPAGGVRIVRVLPGLTAESLKLQDGDILASLNDTKISSVADVQGFMRTNKAGKELKVVVKRGEKEVSASGKILPRPFQKAEGMNVRYDQVLSNGKRIRVIVTSPKTAGPHPTVFVIGGIGAYSLDGDFASIGYGNILEPIAKAGYAIVRIDKPGQGDSEGPAYTDLGFNVELDAYIQALRLSKTLPEVDKDRIAIFGHSMGGTFGPLVAAEEKVKGVAAAATLYRSWIEYVLENSRRQMTLSGNSAGAIDEQMRRLTALNHYLYNEDLSPADIAKKSATMKETVEAEIPDGKTYSGVGIPFFRELSKKNLGEAWMKSDCQVLALWGEAEFISGLTDHQMIVDAVNRVRPGTAELKTLANSDHGFFNVKDARESAAKWGTGQAPFNPNVIDALLDWLNRKIK